MIFQLFRFTALILFFVTLSICLSAQAGTTFQRLYGGTGDDKGYHIISTGNNLLIAGQTTAPGASAPDACLILLDNNGNLLWQKRYGGNSGDAFYYVTEANGGGFLALGTTRSFGQGSADLFVVKTDANGNTIWTRTWGGANDDNPGALLRLADGYMVSGPQSSFGAGIQSFAARLDNNGNTLWEKVYTQDNYCDLRIGYAEADTLFAVGKTAGAACFVKLDANDGTVLYARLLDGNAGDALFSLIPGSDGQFILSESTSSPSGGAVTSQWTCKVNRNGQVLWSKTFTKPGAHIRGNAIAASDDGYLITSQDLSNIAGANPMLHKISKQGFLIWAYSYGGPGADLVYRTVQLPDGGFAAVGYRTVGPGNDDIYLLRTDADGQVDNCCIQALELSVDNFFPIVNAFAPDTLAVPVFNAQNVQAQDMTLVGTDYCAVSGADTTQVSAALCPGQLFYLNGTGYSAPNVLTEGLLSAAGCDSTVVYTLFEVPQPEITRQIDLCPGEVFFVNGVPYSDEGAIVVTIPSPGLCDTIATYIFSFKPVPVKNDTFLLHPGEAVVLNGNTYYAPGIVTDTLPATVGCDTLFVHTLLLDLSFPDTCSKTVSFLKRLGQRGVYERGGAMCASGDGNFYLSGERWTQTLLLKVTPDGDVLWSRTFKPIPSFETVITQLIEDSDGMLAGCGIVNPDSTSPEAYIFRYDPVANTLLWSRYLKQAKPEAFSIVEKSPGGHYYLLVSPQLTQNVDDAELWEINRQTGAAVGALADHYNYGNSDVWNSMVVHDGALYVVGRHIPGPVSVPADLSQVRIGLSRIDTLTDLPVWSRLSHIDSTAKVTIYGSDLLIDDGAILALSTGFDSNGSAQESAFFLQRNTLDGDLIWLRRYHIPGYQVSEAHEIERINDGYLLTGQVLSSTDGWDQIVVKTGFNGNVLWAKKIKAAHYQPSKFFLHNHRSVVKDNVLYLTGMTEDVPSDILLLKMTADGYVSDSCGFVQPVDVQEQVVIDPVNKPIQVPVAQFVVQSYAAPAALSSAEIPSAAYCLRCCDPVLATNTILFCPGDTITLGGNIYTQPGIVIDTIPGGVGCDTIITSILNYVETPGATISITCPDDVDIAISPGAGPVIVAYDLPLVESACTCPGTALDLTEGPLSGQVFPVGTTLVCYAARDSCGNTASCCFEVTIREASGCDVKETSCLSYELLSITQSTPSALTYRIRATNKCAGKLIYTAIQIPDGVAATAPGNNTVFTAQSGRTYDVRNPNYSPFYSVRFKSQADSIANGQSDVFEYTIPGQAPPVYLHITSRLYPQVFYEAFLNTYYCPVLPGTMQNAANRDSKPQTTTNTRRIKVFPNPAQNKIFADLSPWIGMSLHIRLLNSQGQLIREQSVVPGEAPVVIDLEQNFANGLYIIEMTSPEGEKQAVRFVKQSD